jgi:hypothetical protein
MPVEYPPRMDDQSHKPAAAGFAPTREQMAGFDADVCAAPFRIAPERNDELLHNVFKGTPWTLEFNSFLDQKRNTFRAMPNAKTVEVNYAALASLWAIAKASWLIAREAIVANRSGKSELDAGPGTAVAEARQLIQAARDLIGNSGARWPTDLAPPVPDAKADSQDWYANNVFLGATGWVVLHEIAHIFLNHQATVSSDVSFKQEHEADFWAADWILGNVPGGDTRGYFRLFTISVALTWLAILDHVRRGSTTHPHAWQRLEKLSPILPQEQLNPGYEMAAYVLKVVFLADDETPPAEHPEAAFFDLLVEANRQAR